MLLLNVLINHKFHGDNSLYQCYGITSVQRAWTRS